MYALRSGSKALESPIAPRYTFGHRTKGGSKCADTAFTELARAASDGRVAEKSAQTMLTD